MPFEKQLDTGWSPFYSFRNWLLACALLFGGCICTGTALLYWADGEDVIETIDCGSGREIIITAARSWEISQPIYYLVRVDGRTVVPTYCIAGNRPGNDPRSLHFVTSTNKTGNLVGVAYTDSPSDYLIIHDFNTGNSFPCNNHNREGMADRLNASPDSKWRITMRWTQVAFHVGFNV